MFRKFKRGFVKRAITKLKNISFNNLVKAALFGEALSFLALSGCNSAGTKIRLGVLPSATIGTPFIDLDSLGSHDYGSGFSEKGGIIYTCEGGHIDIDHLRGSADATKYLFGKTQETLIRRGKEFSYHLPMENSIHKIKFSYPNNWEEIQEDKKKEIIKEVSLELSPYLAYNTTTWHEIITWFGTHFAGFEPEFNSAFSWEDMYSNLLGTKIATKVLKDENKDYSSSMTIEIDRELRSLGAKSSSIAKNASAKMSGKWFKGILLVDILKKNMDIGEDGYVTPTLVPEISECPDAKPKPCPVPNLENITKLGFNVEYDIDPRVWESSKILKIVYKNGERNGNKIIPEKHFPKIMSFIREEAINKYGYDVDY